MDDGEALPGKEVERFAFTYLLRRSSSSIVFNTGKYNFYLADIFTTNYKYSESASCLKTRMLTEVYNASYYSD